MTEQEQAIGHMYEAIRHMHEHQETTLFSEVPAFRVVEWRQPRSLPWQMWLTLGGGYVLNLQTGKVHLVGGSLTKVVILCEVDGNDLKAWLLKLAKESSQS